MTPLCVAILDMRNSQISLADRVRGDKMDHCAKFRQNSSTRCGDIVIFRLFKMAAAAMLDFQNSQFLAYRVPRDEMHQHAKFPQIGQYTVEI